MTTHDSLAQTIEAAFEARDTVSTDTKGEVRDAVETALNLLDSGEARVASRGEDGAPAVVRGDTPAAEVSPG